MAAVEQFKGYKAVLAPREGNSTRVFLVDPMSAAHSDTPAYYSEHPDFVGHLLIEKEVAPYGQTTASRVPTHALVTCKYSNLAMAADGTPIAEFGIGVSVLEVGGGRTWASGPAVDQPLSIPYIHMTVSLSLVTVRANLGAYIACANKVNALAFAPSWADGYIFGAETVRFELPFISKEYDVEAGSRCRVRIELAVNCDRSWNSARNDLTGLYEYTNPRLFETADLSVMGI